MQPLDDAQKPALTSDPGCVVLDTNVVLDWLLFANPHGQALGTAVTQGQLRWIATAAMRDEFSHVLGRGLAASRGAQEGKLLGIWDRLAQSCPAAAASALVCSDPDDQKFLDLGLAIGGARLITRDRALLRLRARARMLGLAILKPDDTACDAWLASLPGC